MTLARDGRLDGLAKAAVEPGAIGREAQTPPSPRSVNVPLYREVQHIIVPYSRRLTAVGVSY